MPRIKTDSPIINRWIKVLNFSFISKFAQYIACINTRHIIKGNIPTKMQIWYSYQNCGWANMQETELIIGVSIPSWNVKYCRILINKKLDIWHLKKSYSTFMLLWYKKIDNSLLIEKSWFSESLHDKNLVNCRGCALFLLQIVWLKH